MKKIFLIINPIIGIGLLTAGYFAGKKANKEKTLKAPATLYITDGEDGEPEELFFANKVPVSDLKKENYITVVVKNIKKVETS